MAERRIHVLGPMHIALDGTPIRLAGRLTRALLARLVIAQGRAVSTDRLVDELWDGEPPPKATSVLQVHVHNLRRVFEPERPARAPATVVVSEGLGYALRLRDTEVDAWQFESLLHEYLQVSSGAHAPEAATRTRMLDTALACWNGRALESFADCGWAAAEAARLTDLYLTAGELRAQAALELGRTTEVISGLRRTVEDRPDREESVRLLALAQYRLGQQTEALATLRRTAEFLTREMGLDPGQRIQELETAILNQAVPVLDSTVPTASLAVRADIVRDITRSSAEPAATTTAPGYPVQRKVVLEAACEAAEHGARVVWVCGGAGFGKSTLTETVAAELRRRDWVVATGRCPEIDGAPQAWVWAEVAARFGADLTSRPVLGGAFEISRVIADRCRKAVADGPVALILEDLHRADEATLQILRQAMAWLHDQPLLVIATLRETEAPPPVRAAVAALADPTAAHIELTGVDLDGTCAIARAAGLSGLDTDLLALLHERTGGNPLFLRELTAAMAVGGDVHTLPPSTRGVIEQQLARMPDPVREVLEYAAVCGERVEPATLVALTGRSEHEIVDLVGTAEVARLVIIDPAGRIMFAHPLIRDTVYAGIAQLRRTRMHQGVLALLGGCRPDDARAVEVLAHHAVRAATASTADSAVDYITTAARHCVERGMRADAAPLWRTVIELRRLAGHEDDDAPAADRIACVDAYCELVTASAYAGRIVAARDAREQALRLATALGDGELVVRALTSWRAPVVWAMRDWRWTNPRLRRALAVASARDQPVATQARLLITAVFEASPAAHRLAHTRAHAALKLARSTGNAELQCMALNALTHLVLDGHSGDGLGYWTAELERIATAADLPHYRALAHYLHFRTACRDVDLIEAGRQATLALEFAATAQVRPLATIFGYFRAATEILRGDISRAAHYFDESVSAARDSGFPHGDEAALIALLPLGWARRDLSPAADALADIEAALPGMLTQIYIVALLDAGARAEAAALFHHGPEVDEHFYPVLMRAHRARAAIALGSTADCAELYRRLLPAAGTVAGLETGFTPLDPVDEILADLAAACGDGVTAAKHRAAATRLRERIRKQLRSTQLTNTDTIGPAARDFPAPF
ncbi:BTAD domain-containing putative transcriptional regulator [Nocardia violaceofusca]|uniref:BTAD domain-containing putative transcriptional regulator n=1 Tax=Nocardia violaceofusca TaxID=941182 RepID=UPI0007A55F89|nr:BTAD domain-containing putative transcriptional regulator [Nocardia violaceofusca]